MSRNCFFSEDGRINQFSCALTQECCGAECCNSDFKFYTHWYFWVAVAVLVMFLIAAVISGYCKHKRQQPPYRMLNTISGTEHSAFIPWVWGLDEAPSPREFQHVQTSRPFLFPYNGTRSASSQTVAEVSDETAVK